MKSGPDVFADALVPSGRIHPAGTHRLPERQSPGAPVSRSAIFPETYRFDGRTAGTWRDNPFNSNASSSAITDPHRGRVPVFGGFERQLVEHHTGRRVCLRPCSMFAGKTLVRLP